MFPSQPDNGPHAAAALTDAQLEQLMEIVHWEAAMRMDRDGYHRLLRNYMEARDRSQDRLDSARGERERLTFAQDVLRDIAALPVTRAA